MAACVFVSSATSWPVTVSTTFSHLNFCCLLTSVLFLSPVLTRAKRFSFFMPTLPCLVAFCQAFPPLYDDVAALLVQVGQVCASDVATKARDIDPLIARKYSTVKSSPDRRSHVEQLAATCIHSQQPPSNSPVRSDAPS